MEPVRMGKVERETRETAIRMVLVLDGTGQVEIDTGIPFFDHMLELFAHHGLLDLNLKASGDLGVDYHHTVEDVGLALGKAVREALGDKVGIRRYGYALLPMDECLSRVVLDLGGRPFLVYRVETSQSFVRDFNIGLVREFLQAFANTAGANLHAELLYGTEPHHVAESLFKAFGRALRQAAEPDPRREGSVPSTKGILS